MISKNDLNPYTIPMQNLSRLHSTMEHEVLEEIRSIVNSSQFIGGPWVKRFEEEFAQYLTVGHVVGVANGTDALEILLTALGVVSGDAIIVPNMSFVATAEAVINCGGTPVFADTDPSDFLMTGTTLRAALQLAEKHGLRVKGAIAVHLYGKPCDMVELLSVCEDKGIFLIEDCAQAHGAARYNTQTKKFKMVGSWGVASAFSFYPGKNLGAWGDAGAIATNSPDLAQKCRLIANHGRMNKYDHIDVGRNSRLDAIQALVLCKKLPHLNEWNENRRSLAKQYIKRLEGINGLKLLGTYNEDYSKHVYHQFVLQLESLKLRDALQEHLKSKGVETSVHYPDFISNYPPYIKYLPQQYTSPPPIMSLPLDPLMSAKEISDICSFIQDFL